VHDAVLHLLGASRGQMTNRFVAERYYRVPGGLFGGITGHWGVISGDWGGYYRL